MTIFLGVKCNKCSIVSMNAFYSIAEGNHEGIDHGAMFCKIARNSWMQVVEHVQMIDLEDELGFSFI